MTLRWTLITILLAGIALASTCTRSATENDASIGTESTEQVGSVDSVYWIDVMREGTSEARKQGREAVIALGTEAVPALIEATRDELHFIRWEAVNALGTLAGKDPVALVEAIPALVERATRDDNPHPRWRSLWAISTFPDDVVAGEAVPRMWDALAVDDDQFQWYTTVALAYFGEADVAPRLHDGLDREDAFDRWEAVYCLGFVHDEDSVGVLVGALLDVELADTKVRQEAALTLRDIADPAAIPALLEALLDPEPAVRWRAASALASLAGASVLPELEDALAQETDSLALEQMEGIVARLREASDGA
jgi:HEAT repeat protein